MTKLKVSDLFSGIGGFSLGLERTGGFETTSFTEIDPFCRKVLKKHWPDIPCHDDITTREFKEGEADVICGGFPCPDISNAGKRAGITGLRSGLYRQIVRAVRVVRPLYTILENVAALLGRGMGVVLGDLAASGQDCEWGCLPASFIGAPHHRDRVWIVAYPNGSRGPRLVENFNLGTSGSWGWRGKEDLRALEAFAGCDRWPQPLIRRMDDGVHARVHRIRTMGNAVVPQIPEIIGHAILEAHNAR